MSETYRIEVDGHVQWLAERAREFGQAAVAEQLRVVCASTPGSQITADHDVSTADGYHEVMNAAAGQMQAICAALADAILGRAQS